MFGETFLLLKSWLQNPRKIGAIAPSSPELAQAMASHAPLEGEGIILELGGGTGPVTRALLKQGVAKDRLIVVERDQGLYEHLRRQHPDIKILQGDAAHLQSLLHAHGISKVDAIISSLPLLAMSKSLQEQIGKECFTVLKSGAPLVQFTYGFLSPLPRRPLGIQGKRANWIARNLPPAIVWVYRHLHA